MTLHLIPEPEEKASELLRDLTANDVCAFGRAEFGGFLCSMTESVLIKETRRLTMEDPI